jgi:hypothetical protein
MSIFRLRKKKSPKCYRNLHAEDHCSLSRDSTQWSVYQLVPVGLASNKYVLCASAMTSVVQCDAVTEVIFCQSQDH